MKVKQKKRLKKEIQCLQSTLAFKTTGATSTSANNQATRLVIGPTVKAAKRIREYEKSLQEFNEFDLRDSIRMASESQNDDNQSQRKAKRFLVQRFKSN